MSEFVESIRKAVAALDPANDEHWTQAGLPDVVVVRGLADDASVTRADIEAACPDVNRGDVKVTDEVKDDGAQEPDANAETTPETPSQGGEAGEDEPTPPDEDTGEVSEEAAPEADGGMTIGGFMRRGILMALIMRLPKPMRVIADVTMLDSMSDFVEAFHVEEERMVAVEMIRSIAETHMQEIPSGQYKGRVLAAMDVVRGEFDHVRTGVAPADDQKAAAARLAKITGQGTAQPPGYQQPSALQGATDEQAEAHARLYGGGDENFGVRPAEE